MRACYLTDRGTVLLYQHGGEKNKRGKTPSLQTTALTLRFTKRNTAPASSAQPSAATDAPRPPPPAPTVLSTARCPQCLLPRGPRPAPQRATTTTRDSAPRRPLLLLLLLLPLARLLPLALASVSDDTRAGSRTFPRSSVTSSLATSPSRTWLTSRCAATPRVVGSPPPFSSRCTAARRTRTPVRYTRTKKNLFSPPPSRSAPCRLS